MYAVVMAEFGGPDVLRLRQVPDPLPGPGQVLVDVRFAGITFVEAQIRSGYGPFRPPLPRVPGNGVGGRIVSVGPGVDAGLVGAQVVTTTGGTGGYAELAVASAEDVVPVPSGVALRDAVALLADGRTALLLHSAAAVKAGEQVLVLAAAGGLGSLLVQLAVSSGARVVGAARGKASLIIGLGAEHVVDYSRPDWAQQVVSASGGVDVVFDGVGGPVGAQALTTIRSGGRISIHGMASGSYTEPGDVTVVDADGAATPSLSEQALRLAAAGALRPVIGQTYPLAAVAEAHRAIDTRATVGKTLLVVS
ncbi:MAG: zinc-binding dehydrogenase [Kibdelosporangium sp.]